MPDFFFPTKDWRNQCVKHRSFETSSWSTPFGQLIYNINVYQDLKALGMPTT